MAMKWLIPLLLGLEGGRAVAPTPPSGSTRPHWMQRLGGGVSSKLEGLTSPPPSVPGKRDSAWDTKNPKVRRTWCLQRSIVAIAQYSCLNVNHQVHRPAHLILLMCLAVQVCYCDWRSYQWHWKGRHSFIYWPIAQDDEHAANRHQGEKPDCYITGDVTVHSEYNMCSLSFQIDPYLNVDAGTMSPFEHGEVFVLDDGGETDLVSCEHILS